MKKKAPASYFPVKTAGSSQNDPFANAFSRVNLKKYHDLLQKA